MSWTVTLPNAAKEGGQPTQGPSFRQLANEEVAATPDNRLQDGAAREQAEFAAAIAAAIVDRPDHLGGDDNSPFGCTISGHRSTEEPGSSPDSINITVWRIQNSLSQAASEQGQSETLPPPTPAAPAQPVAEAQTATTSTDTTSEPETDNTEAGQATSTQEPTPA